MINVENRWLSVVYIPIWHFKYDVKLSRWWTLSKTPCWHKCADWEENRLHTWIGALLLTNWVSSVNHFNLSQSSHRSWRSGLHRCDQRFFSARARPHPRQKHLTQRSCCQRWPPAVRWQDTRSESHSGVRWSISSIVICVKSALIGKNSFILHQCEVAYEIHCACVCSGERCGHYRPFSGGTGGHVTQY